MRKNYFLILIVILSINYTSLFATETLTPVHIQSDNASSSLAKVGDNIALTFTSSGAISGVVVTIAGHNITGGNLTNVGNNWTATYTTISGDAEGTIMFTIDYTEKVAQVVSTTDGSSVTFDKTSPSAPTISGISAGYHNADQIFTVSGEAGATIEYSLNNGGTWTAYAGAVTISSEGNYNVLARQTDQAGNGSTTLGVIALTIDKTNPAAPVISGISAGYHNTDQIFTISGEAGATIEYSINNGGAWAAYVGAVTISSEGNYNVLARQTDQAGNGSTISGVISLTIDKTAPPAPTISGISAGYHNTDQIFTISGEAGATIEYSINNGGTWTAYAGAVTTSSEGSYNVLARQTDQAGNGSTVSGVISLTIDKTAPPAPTISGISARNYNSDQIFTVSGEAGATIEYSLNNGGTWTAYAGAVTISSEGSYNVLARQTDQAGNGSTTSGVISLTIDKTGPNAPTVTGVTPTSDQTPTWTWSSGGGGGNLTFRYKLDNNDLTSGATTTPSLSYTPGTNLTETSHTLYVQESDASGNWSASGSFVITIDVTTQAPILTLPSNNSFINKDVEIKFTLPEAAKSGTVKMTFIRPSATDRSVTFTPDFETSGEHTTVLNGEDLVNNIHVASGNGNNYLYDTGIYSIKIEYQDLLGNTISSVTNTNIQYGSTKPTPSFQPISSPRNTRVGIVNLNFDKYVRADRVTWDDFTLIRNGTTNIPLDNSLPFTFTFDYDYTGWYSNSFTLDLTDYNTLTDGTYELKLKATGTSIRDFYGNDLMSGANVVWTMDATPPTLTSVHIQSNNANPTFAKPGNEITVSFTASETIQTPTATINGNAASVSFVSGNSWTAKYTMVNGDTEGDITFNVSFQDLAGNSANVNSVSDGSSVTFLKSAPTLTTAAIKSNNANIALAKSGNTITLDFTSAKALANVVVTIASHTISATGSNGDKTWTASYTMVGTDLEGVIPFTIDFTDKPGNAGVRVTSTTDASSVIFDRTNPTLTNVTIYSNNTYADRAGVGTKVFVTFTSSENLGSGTVSATIAGKVATISGANQSWTASYTMQTTDNPEGIITFGINYKDLVGNSGALVSTVTDASSVTFDKTSPTLSSVSVVSSNVTNTLAKVGDAITVSFTAGEVVEGVSIKLNGKNLVATNPSGNNWSASYTMLSSDAEGSLFVTIDCKDQVGNTAQATNSDVTFDKTLPAFTEIKIASNNSSSTSYAKENDEVTITFKTSETIKTPTVTINSLAATVVNTIGNTWTAKRTMSLSETEGLITFSIPIFDLANNSITGNLTTDASRVTVDRTSPVITSVAVPAGNYGIGSTIVTTISTDANTYIGQTVTVNGNPLTLVNMGDNSYKVYYTVQASDVNQSAVATLPVNIVLKDYAGNSSSAVTSALVQGGVLTIDTYPTVRITGSTTKCNYPWQKVPITFTFTGVKPYQLTYRFTSSGGTITNFGPIPINADSYQIEGVNGGTYSLVSLTDNTTNTQTTAITNATITINPLPSLTFNVTASPYTLGQSPDPLSAYVNLTGGTFWGNGVSNGIFYPSIVGVIGEVKTSEVFYSYTNAFGCRDTVSYIITVGEGVYFGGIKPNYCKNIWADKETITVQNVGTVTYENFTVTPATAGWSQLGGFSHKVEFDPKAMTPGTYTLRYDYISGGKSDFKIQEFKVVKVTNNFDINAALKKDHYCVDTTNIQLVDNSSTPAFGEGHFSGPTSGFTTVIGSTSATFSPSTTVVNQDHKISYYYSKDGCNSDTVSKTVRVNTLPVVDFTVLKSNYNFNETPIVLTGSPAPTNIDSYFVGEVITKDGYGNTILNPSRATTIGSDITITYKYKEGATGCSNSKPRTTRVYKADEPIKVVKADLTKVDIKTTYCYADTILTISCTPMVDGLTKAGVFSSKKDAVTTLTPNTAEYSIKKAGEGQDTLTFSYDIGGTLYEIKKAVYIDLVGPVSLDLYSNFCKNGEEVTIMPSHKIIPGQNIFSYDGRPAAFISYALNAKFSPQQEVEGLHQITYTFKTDRGCSNTVKYPINVRPIPEVNFSIESDCTPGLNKDIKFINNTNIPSGCTVANWLWDWADGTTSSVENPLPHKYLLAGSREVKLTATTDFNCVVTKKVPITVGLSPTADFKWDNDCKSDNPVKFIDQSTNGTFVQWTWKLNDVVSPIDNDTINLPLPNVGKYNVELKAKTNDGCLTSVTKEIVIQPNIKFQDLSGNLYAEDFETHEFDWYPKGNSNSSWTYGTPSGEIIKNAASGVKSWYTNINLDNQQLENSNIVSPCFDFTGLQKPMIKMSIWSAPDPGGDGAVLQYLLDGKGAWKNLGEPSKGVNWYTPGNIQGQPGGQSYGWSSDPIMTNWNTARYNLDTLVGQKNVRFRIAYATKGTSHKQYNGFAFDDVWIGERQQGVLAEYFTSSASTVNNSYIKKLERKKKEDIIPIHYHNNDLLFNDYTAGPSSRKFYYGVSVIPSVLSNGTILSTLSNDKTEFETKTDAVSLMDPKIAFDALYANNGDVVLRLKALQDISGQNLVLYCALVKDSILVGNTYYYNVLRRFIPSPGGIMLSAGIWIKDQIVSQTIPMNIDNPAEFINAKLVAFIQNSTTNEVYQVASYKTSALTGDHPMDISNLVDIYPNPARDYLIIESESNIGKLTIFDLAGRVIGIYIPAQTRFSLPVQDMENGLYIIKGNTKKGEFIKKFIKQ